MISRKKESQRRTVRDGTTHAHHPNNTTPRTRRKGRTEEAEKPPRATQPNTRSTKQHHGAAKPHRPQRTPNTKKKTPTTATDHTDQPPQHDTTTKRTKAGAESPRGHRRPHTTQDERAPSERETHTARGSELYLYRSIFDQDTVPCRGRQRGRGDSRAHEPDTPAATRKPQAAGHAKQSKPQEAPTERERSRERERGGEETVDLRHAWNEESTTQCPGPQSGRGMGARAWRCTPRSATVVQ